MICGLLLRCVQVHQLLKEYDSEAGQAEMVVRAEGGEETGCWLVSTVDLEPGQQIQVVTVCNTELLYRCLPRCGWADTTGCGRSC